MGDPARPHRAAYSRRPDPHRLSIGVR